MNVQEVKEWLEGSAFEIKDHNYNITFINGKLTIQNFFGEQKTNYEIYSKDGKNYLNLASPILLECKNDLLINVPITKLGNDITIIADEESNKLIYLKKNKQLK